MIDRVLDRDFILRQARGVRDELDRQSVGEAAAEEGVPEEGLPKEGLPKARDALTAALAREDPHQEAVAAEDAVSRKTWIPRDLTLSVLQTILEERIVERHADQLRDTAGRAAPGDPIATQVVEEGGLERVGDFTTDDPGWYSGLAKALARRLWRGRHTFVTANPPPTHPMAEDARVILVSDWGTGGPAAQAVAALIREELRLAGDRETHVVHLGDVYYSGEEWEAQTRFLDRWPVRPDEAERHSSWALMGNHEMYSGGHAYYKTILADPRFRGQRTPDGRGISYFALENRFWQVLGIDTAWDDHLLIHQGHDGYLQDPQDEWIAARVRDARSRDCRTMLLSHHQFYSTHANIEGNLADKLKPAFDAGGIDAWFWGHEHRCQTFQPRPEVRYSACVGHGAMPEAVGDSEPEPGEWEFDQGQPDGDGDQWRWCGFAVLDFKQDRVRVRYVNEQIGEFDQDLLPEP